MDEDQPLALTGGMRKVTPRVGATAWVGGHRVLINSVDQSAFECLVAFNDGVREKISFCRVDSGWEFQLEGGDYVHESDPRVARWLATRIERLLEENVEPLLRMERENSIERMRHIVRRTS